MFGYSYSRILLVLPELLSETNSCIIYYIYNIYKLLAKLLWISLLKNFFLHKLIVIDKQTDQHNDFEC